MVFCYSSLELKQKVRKNILQWLPKCETKEEDSRSPPLSFVCQPGDHSHTPLPHTVLIFTYIDSLSNMHKDINRYAEISKLLTLRKVPMYA